jgi:hypothetical protein
LLAGTTVDLHAGDPGHRFDARDDVILDEPAEIGNVAARTGQLLDEEPGQRLVGFLALHLHDRRIGIRRQRRQAVEPSEHFDKGRLHVAADREGQVDECAAGVGIAVHLLQSRDALQYRLDRLHQLGLDLDRRRCPPERLHRHLWAVDIRKQLQRQPGECQRPEQQHQGHDDGHRCGILHGIVDQAHDSRFPAVHAACAAFARQGCAGSHEGCAPRDQSRAARARTMVRQLSRARWQSLPCQ